MGKIGCIRAKVVVLEQKWFYSGKVVVVRGKWLYSGKVVVYGQNWLYSCKSGRFRAKVVLFGQGGCGQGKWLYSGKVVVFGQKCVIQAKWWYLSKSCCIRA